MEIAGCRIASNRYGRYCVPLSSAYTYTSRAILAGQVHEPETLRYIAEHHGGRDIVHAGAGYGDFLPALAAACAGTVWAMEPNEDNHRCAQQTLELNGLSNVQLLHCALGERGGEALLRVSEEGLSLGPRSVTVEADTAEQGLQACPMQRLDDLLPTQEVSLVHLDTEGHEFRILDGARALIARCRPLVILEIDAQALRYNRYMAALDYRPVEQLIYNAGEMVFVNTVYAPVEKLGPG